MSKIHFIVGVFLVALASSFIILLIGKLGIRDYVVARAPKLISKLFECDFCLSFWVGTILAIILAIIYENPNTLFISVFSTSITRILI